MDCKSRSLGKSRQTGDERKQSGKIAIIILSLPDYVCYPKCEVSQ